MTGWRELSFAGRTAVVTGAARGIGRAVAFRLAGLGARTVIWDVDGGAAERTAAELANLLRGDDRPDELAWRQVDVTDPAAVADGMGEGLDVLVNNAGTTTVHASEDLPLEEWDGIMRVNLRGTFLCCRAVVTHMMTELWRVDRFVELVPPHAISRAA